MPRSTASDFLLRLNAPDANGCHPVEVMVDGIGLWTGGRVRFDFDALAEARTASDYGRRLWAMLVDRENGWEELRDIWNGNGSVRVRIMLSTEAHAAAIHSIKWELLVPAGDTDPAGVDVDRPLSRFLPLRKLDLRDRGSTREVLLAIANPTGLPGILSPIDVDGEVNSLLDAWELGIRENRVGLTVIPGRTGLTLGLRERLRGLQAKLVAESSTVANIGRHLQGKDVLHVIAHGNFDQDVAILMLEKEDGAIELPNTKDLIVQWAQHKPLLIFLQSCLSDPQDKTLPVAGLGPGFVEKDVPAVIAMRDLVDMKAARAFAAAFYRNLLEIGEPDVAANIGRSVNYKARTTAWAIPVLYSRLRPGERLWRPDPLVCAIKALGRRWAAIKDVKHPLPIEVSVVRDLSIVQRELDEPVIDTVVDAVDTAVALLASPERQSRIAVILGPRGHAKTSILKRTYVRLAETLTSDHPHRPVYVRLANCISLGNTAASVDKAWRSLLNEEDITLGEDSTLRQVELGPLQLLVDGDDDLGPELLHTTLQRLIAFAQEDTAERHMVITMDQSVFRPEMFDSASTTVLLVKDMRLEPLRDFLEGCDLEPEILLKLTGPLRDLARVPWLLSRMLEMANDPENLRSRFQVLQRIVRGKLSEVVVSPGASSLASFMLQEMAWQLQYRHSSTLSLSETYKLLATVRGTRDFRLDEFRDSIIKCRLWIESGPGGVRFAYTAAQDYFVACHLANLPPGERHARIGDIIAGVGRLEQLRRWQEVLVLLAGHLRKPEEVIELLLELGFGEGEHLLLAARCVHEAHAAGHTLPVRLGEDVAHSLIWWSLPQSGLPARIRRRGVDALSYLIQPNPVDSQWVAVNNRIIRHLLKLTLQPVRSDLQGRSSGKRQSRSETRLDFSVVRLAAMMVLFQHAEVSKGFLDREGNEFADVAVLVRHWECEDLGGLTGLLNAPDKTVIAGAAAFALAAWGTPEAMQALRNRFFSLPITPDVHWSITDALAELRSESAQDIIKEVTSLSPGYPEEVLQGLRQYVVYAIGKCGALADQAARDYLEQCSRSENVILQGRAIRSRSEVAEVTVEEPTHLRTICHQVLQQQFAPAQRGLGIDPPRRLNSWQRSALTMYVIEALGHIGDKNTIPLLREFYLRPGLGTTDIDEQILRRSSWETAERIRLRYDDRCNQPPLVEDPYNF